ncbi:hypothetical protein FQA47_007997 [Oryzias melastigma]|uniref:Uncharacterized protein n=1 Tax=Oryzias melastigma TaxID=30732 RepID=A0A834FFB1_ORYME|nr:hypothetical protein FQA47_007997 [Oryzias melastigma]
MGRSPFVTLAGRVQTSGVTSAAFVRVRFYIRRGHAPHALPHIPSLCPRYTMTPPRPAPPGAAPSHELRLRPGSRPTGSSGAAGRGCTHPGVEATSAASLRDPDRSSSGNGAHTADTGLGGEARHEPVDPQR